jgi:hypothetical protein
MADDKKKDSGKEQDKKEKKSLFGGDKKIKRQIDFPKSAYDMAADLLPPKLAKKRQQAKNAKTMLFGLLAFIGVLIVLAFGLKASHLLDDLGIPFLSDPSAATSEVLKPTQDEINQARKKAAEANKSASAVNSQQAQANNTAK